MPTPTQRLYPFIYLPDREVRLKLIAALAAAGHTIGGEEPSTTEAYYRRTYSDCHRIAIEGSGTINLWSAVIDIPALVPSYFHTNSPRHFLACAARLCKGAALPELDDDDDIEGN